MMPGARSAGRQEKALVEQDRIGPWAATGLCSTNLRRRKRTYLLPSPERVIPAASCGWTVQPECWRMLEDPRIDLERKLLTLRSPSDSGGSSGSRRVCYD